MADIIPAAAYVAGGYLWNRYRKMPYRPTRGNTARGFSRRFSNATSTYRSSLRGMATLPATRRGPYLRGSYSKKVVYDKTGVLGGTNADVRTTYRKKRMPRRKKRVWRSFIRKVNAIAEKELGTRTVLFNDSITQSYSTGATQGCLTLALYPITNAANGWLNDLNTIGSLENTGDPTAAAGITIDASTKYMFQSAVQDLTIRNTSLRVLTVAPTYENDPNCSLELDVYEVSFKEDSNDSGTSYPSFTAVMQAYDTRQIGNAGTGISISDRGATPWDLPVPLGRFRIKIWKKTKYFIPAGQTITHQIRDPKRHVLRNGDLSSSAGIDGWNRAGMTRILYLVYKAVPGLQVGGAVGNSVPQISIGATRKYMYKIEGANEDRERYISNTYTPGSAV